MKHFLILIISISIGFSGVVNVFAETESTQIPSQQSDLPVYKWPDSVVVTATRTERNPFKLPQAVTVISRSQLRRSDKLSVLDALSGEIGIWVEKRTTTTSDPVIRGMSGFNILALIDGNTLSTMWGEGGVAGDDMYGKVDADVVERIEVVRGPNSVAYGSNALGGVINFVTRSSPYYFTNGGTRLGSAVKSTYSSAADEKRGRFEVFGASERIRFLGGASYHEAGDARAGGDIGTQIPTSGEDLNFDFKSQLRLEDGHELELSLQNTNRDNIHRFYRPNETNFNDRFAMALKYTGESVFDDNDEVITRAYYQYKKDTRMNIPADETCFTKTRTYAASVQWSGEFGSNSLLVGSGFELDDGENPDDEQFTRMTADKMTKDAPDSKWTNYSWFLQDEFKLSNAVTATIGMRYDFFNFATNVDSFYAVADGIDPKIDEIVEHEGTFTGGLAIAVFPLPRLNIYGSVARGFRQYAPVFGIKQHSYGVQVPSGLIESAYSVNYEVGTKYRHPRLQGNLSIYYSNLNNFPVVLPSTYNGKDWFDWDNSGAREIGEDVFKTINALEAYVYGVEIEGQFQFGSGWSVTGGFNWNYGEDESNDEPLRHTIPAWGTIKLAWLEPDNERLWVELSMESARSFDRIPSDRVERDPGYRIDPQDMTSPLIGPGGEIPGWTVLNVRAEYVVSNHMSLNAAIENFTDQAYRRVHSRWDELGINFVIGMSLAY
ncbi:MAG: TonB-dependent receptor [Candidatus Zixiibacteriota bacterium]